MYSGALERNRNVHRQSLDSFTVDATAFAEHALQDSECKVQPDALDFDVCGDGVHVE